MMNHHFSMLPGDTIGIFSPSRGITGEAPAATARAIRLIEQHGYHVKLGTLSGKQDFYRSGTIAQRAAEFNALLYDDSITCVMASIGGYVTNSILPYIDYDYLAEHPKIVVGMSDVTALLLAIYEKTGIQTFYGPNLVTQLALPEPFSAITFDCLEKVIRGELSIYPQPDIYTDSRIDWAQPLPKLRETRNQLRTIIPGRAVGRLIGGNLNTLTAIMGSSYMPSIKSGDILFIENTGETADACERYFSWLKLCGIFEKISGLLIGKHKNYDDLETGRSETDILLEILGSPNFPILADFDCGHTSPILTLPIGGTIEVDAEMQTVILHT